MFATESANGSEKMTGGEGFKKTDRGRSYICSKENVSDGMKSRV